MSREPVKLNIYDMYWMNDYISTTGVIAAASTPSSAAASPAAGKRRANAGAVSASVAGRLGEAEQALDALEHMTGSHSRASTIAQCDEAEINASCAPSVKRFIDQFR